MKVQRIAPFQRSVDVIANVCRPRAQSLLSHSSNIRYLSLASQKGNFVAHYFQPQPQPFQAAKENLPQNAYYLAVQSDRERGKRIAKQSVHQLQKSIKNSTVHHARQRRAFSLAQENHSDATDLMLAKMESAAQHIIQCQGEQKVKHLDPVPQSICTQSPSHPQGMIPKLSTTRVYLGRHKVKGRLRKGDLKLDQSMSVSITQEESLNHSQLSTSQAQNGPCPDPLYNLSALRSKWQKNDQQISQTLRLVFLRSCLSKQAQSVAHQRRRQLSQHQHIPVRHKKAIEKKVREKREIGEVKGEREKVRGEWMKCGKWEQGRMLKMNREYRSDQIQCPFYSTRATSITVEVMKDVIFTSTMLYYGFSASAVSMLNHTLGIFQPTLQLTSFSFLVLPSHPQFPPRSPSHSTLPVPPISSQ